MESSKYYEKQREVKEFNKNNKYRKRGLAIIPTKFGCSFTVRHLNQGPALHCRATDTRL